MITEEKLNISDTIIKHSSDAIITINNEGIIQSWNPAAEKVFEYSEKEAVDQNISIIIPDKEPESLLKKHKASLAKHLETGKTSIIGIGRFNITAQRKSGEEFPVYLSVDKLGDSGFVGIIQDISREHYQTNLFKNIINNLKHVAWTADRDGNINFLSDAWVAWTGRKKEDSMGTAWAESVHPEDIERLLKMWEEALKDGQPYSGECRFVHLDGRITFCTFLGVPIKVNGVVTNWVGLDIDITEQKEREEELQKANEETNTALKAKTDFIANMSHEIRTPLNSIMPCLS